MAQPVIEVKNLSKTYKYSSKKAGLFESARHLFHKEEKVSEAVKEINFEINEGEFVGFIGPNGAGKTTTLKMLSGILTPTSGEARVLGYKPWERKSEYQKQFALVMGQKNQLWWDLPPIESFVLHREIYEIEKNSFEKNLEELAKLLKVENVVEKPVRQLSLGERMKCELINALLHNPKVLFLDEPTIGLDVVAQKNIRDFLIKYNQEKKTTIILTSHYMRDILQLCPRVVVINLGKIVYDGLLEDLTAQYALEKIITIYFEKEVQRQDLESFGEIDQMDGFKAVIRVSREKLKETAVNILSSSLPVEDIDIGEDEIEKIVRHIFAKKN